MEEKQILMIPGPTPIPPSVLAAMARPMINHRGAEFAELQRRCTTSLKRIFNTEEDVFIFPSSGTGGLEAAIANVVSPGDKVLSVSVGVFGDRFAKIAQAFGADVVKLDFEWGKPADPKVVAERISQPDLSDLKIVLLTHNETSTGVLNDIKELADVIRPTNALILVDAISGMIASPLHTDDWGLDVVISGSQKAWMIPPGMTFLSVSQRAWEVNARCKGSRFFYDFAAMKKSYEKDQTPWTPAVSLIYALSQALSILEREGPEATFARHKQLAAATRAAMRALKLPLLADDSCASQSVTAVCAPEGIAPKDLRKVARDQFGVVLAGGQQNLEPIIFRIGHLGWVDKMDIIAAVSAVEMSLAVMDRPVELGAGVAAAQKVFLD